MNVNKRLLPFLGTVLVTASGLSSQSGTAAVQLSDTALTSRIELEFRTTVGFTEADIEVGSSRGVVTLMGTVENSAEKRRAELVCKRVHGVVDVKNNLTCRSTSASPSIGTDEIKRRFTHDLLLRNNQISVELRNGVARIRGQVDSWYERFHAERIVRQSSGVLAVLNEIEVGGVVQSPDDVYSGG